MLQLAGPTAMVSHLAQQSSNSQPSYITNYYFRSVDGDHMALQPPARQTDRAGFLPLRIKASFIVAQRIEPFLRPKSYLAPFRPSL